MSAVGDVVSSVGGFIFGDSEKPGIMGTGQQRFDQPQMGQIKKDANGNPELWPQRHPGESDSDFNDRRMRFLNGDASAGDPVYETDPYKAWQDPNYAKNQQNLQNQVNTYQNRQAPTISREQIAQNAVTASRIANIERAKQVDLGAAREGRAAQLGKALTYDAKDIGAVERATATTGTAVSGSAAQGQAARIAEIERAQAAQLGPAERVALQDMGKAQGWEGTTVAPEERIKNAQIARDDLEFRKAQSTLMGQLQEQAAGRGPSLATEQLKLAQDRNIAQQNAMAAALGGGSALGTRQAALGTAQAQQQAARDSAMMRIQEQLAAREQLQGVTAAGRAADINVATAQAGMEQQAAMANQAAYNARMAQQAGLTQQAGMFTAEQLNQRQAQQAQLNTQILQGNQQAGNQFQLTQAQLNQQAALANAAAYNQRAISQGELENAMGITNVQGANAMGIANMQSANQMAMANMQAQNQIALANQAASNERQWQQAQLGQQAGLANMAAGNERAWQQGQLGQQMTLANMAAVNQRAEIQGQLNQQNNIFNAGQYNTRAINQAQLNQQANLANQQYYNQGLFANQNATLQNQAMNDANVRYFTEAGLSNDARQQQAMMNYQALQQNAALGYGGLNQRAYEGTREGMGNFMSGVGSALGAVAMFSDEEVKQSVTRADYSLDNFFKQYANLNEGALGPEYHKKKQSGGMMGGMGGMMSMMGKSGAAEGAGASEAGVAAAASDAKAKDLSVQNDKLKAQMAGMSMAQNTGGRGFFGGLGMGMAAGAKASMARDAENAKNAPRKPDNSAMNTNLVMNNPNAAIAMPAGTYGAMTPNGGDIVRQNPYGAGPAMQTWGTPAPEPMYNAPPAGNMDIVHMDPYDPNNLQTWSDEKSKNLSSAYSSSPIGAKTGINSGQMQISNFLSGLKDNYAGSGPSQPMDYGNMQYGGSGPAMMSDKNSKENISEALDNKLADFLNEVHPYEYSYKNPEMDGRGYGRYVSPMAQELEKTDLGKSAVIETPNGKMVDYGKLGGVMLAAQAQLNERVNALEGKKNKPPMKGKK